MEKGPSKPKMKFPKQQQQGWALRECWTPFSSSTHYAFSCPKWFSTKHYIETNEKTSHPEAWMQKPAGGPQWRWIPAHLPEEGPAHQEAHRPDPFQKELHHRSLGGFYQLKVGGNFLSRGLIFDVHSWVLLPSDESAHTTRELTGNENFEVPPQPHQIRKHIFKRALGFWNAPSILDA